MLLNPHSGRTFVWKLLKLAYELRSIQKYVLKNTYIFKRLISLNPHSRGVICMGTRRNLYVLNFIHIYLRDLCA